MYWIVVCVFVWCGQLGNLLAKETPKEPYVYEMDDRIIDFTTQGKWLITFYAPWCGHCKKLEPVFEEVGKYYHGTTTNIARIDATRYVKAANHFEIKGYPTIKFVYGKINVNYFGERRKEDLIDFVEKCEAPRVQRILHQLDFENTKHKVPVMFLIVMVPDDYESKMKHEFFELAEKYFLNAYFYYTKPDYIIKTAKITKTPQVAVMKENEFILWNSSEHSMERFIKLEQHVKLPEVTLTNFHNLLETNKILVILLIAPEDKSKITPSRKIKQLFKMFCKLNKNSYHKEFQFGYTENTELLSSIAIWSLTPPLMFIFNTTSYQYSLVFLTDSKNRIVEFSIENILDDIRNDRMQFYGGQSWLRSLRKPFWEIYRAILEMFVEAPFISLMIFGLPFGVISIVCYFLCCVDASDQPDAEDFSDSEEEEHQYLLDEASRLHDEMKSNTKLEGEENKIKLPSTQTKKFQ